MAIVKGISVRGATKNWIVELNRALSGIDKASGFIDDIASLLRLADKTLGTTNTVLSAAYKAIDATIRAMWSGYLSAGDVHAGIFINFQDFWADEARIESIFRDKQLGVARIDTIRARLARDTVFQVAADIRTPTSPPWRDRGDLAAIMGLVFTNPDPVKLMEGVIDLFSMIPGTYQSPPLQSAPITPRAIEDGDDVVILWTVPVITSTPFASLTYDSVVHGAATGETWIDSLDLESGKGWTRIAEASSDETNYRHKGAAKSGKQIYRLGFPRVDPESNDLKPPLQWSKVEWSPILDSNAPVPDVMDPANGATVGDGWRYNDWYIAHHILGLIPGLDDSVNKALSWTGSLGKGVAGGLANLASLLDGLAERGVAITKTLGTAIGIVSSFLSAITVALSSVDGYVVFGSGTDGFVKVFDDIESKYYEVRGLEEDSTNPQYQAGIFIVTGTETGSSILEKWGELLGALG